MKPFHYLIALSLVTIAKTTHAQQKYSRVKLDIPPAGLAWLEAQGVEMDHGELNREENTFITTLDSFSLHNLNKTGVHNSILIDDETTHFRNVARRENFYKQADAIMVNGQLAFENPCGSHYTSIAVPAGFIDGSYGGYYTWQEMQQRIDSLVHHYPSLVQKIVLPTNSLEGRPLIVVKISDNVSLDEPEPEAFYTGLHHAREGMSMMNLFFFMQYLAENYASDDRIRDLVNSRQLFFMPCVNPDGYRYNETSAPGGGGMWRKNRRLNAGGQYGVDLNRNYNVDWGITGPNISTSYNPSNDAYVGTGPFSEPETQAIRAFAATRHFTIAIDHHAYGNYYVTPYGVPSSHPFTTTDASFYSYASALMSRYNGYFAGDGMATVGYLAVGNSRDWHIAGDLGLGTKQKTYGYTVEIGSGNTGFGFWPDPENIIPISKSMFFANLQMAYMAGSYFELQDMDPIAVNLTAGNFAFSLRRIGLTDAPVTVKIMPVENIASVGGPVTVNTFASYFDTVQRQIAYTLPTGISDGSRIRFAYEISSAGITLRDTITKIFQPVTLFSDNMEGAPGTNWSFANGWGSSTAAAYQGSRSLTESPSGNYAAGSSSTATCINTFDLSDASAAYLSFWVKHRAENTYDKMQVQVSTGGTYQPVCGNHTVSENVGTLGNQPALTGMRDAWTREVIDLRNYLGNAAVSFRFRFTANGASQYDGFYIDNVELVKATTIVLSSRFISIHGSQTNEGVVLTWQASVDQQHERFDVERSVDGKQFQVIGAVTGMANFRYVDVQPGRVNYYRVRAIDRNGHIDYSRILVVESGLMAGWQVYPNPVAQTLFVRFNATGRPGLVLTVTDIAGRLKYRHQVSPGDGPASLRIDVSTWPSQVYLLHTKDPVTGEVSVFKVVKK